MQSQTELMDEVLDVYVEHEVAKAGSAPNSNTRSTMVSPMGGNVGDDKELDDRVISTAMEVGFGDTVYGKDV